MMKISFLRVLGETEIFGNNQAKRATMSRKELLERLFEEHTPW